MEPINTIEMFEMFEPKDTFAHYEVDPTSDVIISRNTICTCHQAHSQWGAGVRRTTPNLSKGPLLVTKWAKNWVFVGGLRG